MKKLIILFLLLIPIKTKAYFSSAVSTVLMDTDNKVIIYASNEHRIQSVASISKIMTSIIAIESGKLEDKVIIGDEVNPAYGSGIYIKKSEELTLKDLVYGLLLRSGNELAYTRQQLELMKENLII